MKLHYLFLGTLLTGCSIANTSGLKDDDTTPNMTIGLAIPGEMSQEGLDYARVIATSRSESCENWEFEGSYPQTATVSSMLNPACEYGVSAKIGAMVEGEFVEYFGTTADYVVNPGHLNAKVRFSPIMKRTEAGEDVGFTELDTSGAAPVLLTNNQNAQLVGTGGSTSMVDRFKGKYMLVEFSKAGCPYCVDLARAHGSDDIFKHIVTSGKCSTTTVVPRLGPWLSLGFDDVIKQSSFQGNHNSMAQAFNVNFAGGVPFVFIIDRSGNRVWPEQNQTSAYYERAEATRKFKELCGQ